MIYWRIALVPGWVLAAFLLAFATAGSPSLRAAELDLRVQLVWGTNGNKPKDKVLKEVDPELKAKLGDIFKWKDYYEVYRKDVKLATETNTKLKVSEKCRLELTHFGDASIEVKVYGEGKLVLTKRQPVTPGKLMVFAGDDRNDTAWFIVLTPAK